MNTVRSHTPFSILASRTILTGTPRVIVGPIVNDEGHNPYYHRRKSFVSLTRKPSPLLSAKIGQSLRIERLRSDAVLSAHSRRNFTSPQSFTHETCTTQ